MSSHTLKRAVYGHVIGASACVGKCISNKTMSQDVHVFYGGARAGYRGGPQVKVDLLQQLFPEHITNFNLLYLLSGALYMPSWAIKNLKNQNVPVVLNQNGVFYPAWFPDKWREENARMARAMELSDHVFYQSEFCKKSADTFLGVSAKSYDILYNGVDTDFFKPIKHPVRNDYFTFLLSGNIAASTYYRLTNALDGLEFALRQGLNVKIRFSGILPQTLQAQFINDIEKRNLQDRFLMSGAYSREQAPQIFGSADAYFITKHNDPCPNVVLEAMACGLPILYAASGGVPELVGEAGVSLAVPETYDESPAPSAEAIADSMAKIIQQRDVFSALARERAVQKFDIQLWAEHHQIVFDRLVNRCQ